jgi:tRNA(Ile)-lysidine synthase
MAPKHPFERELVESWPPDDWREVTVLVAVSGGADSVALACAMAALRGASPGRVIVAHFNHLLRGDEAAADERFVLKLSHKLGLACDVGREPVAERAALAGDGLESAARAARHQFFQAAADRHGARYVATAHTAEDQAETILHRVLRGTGLNGLAGMPRARPLGPATSLIRPLLTMRRAQVLDYLAELGQPHHDDTTNADTRFTRNRLRHELLPTLAREFNPQVIESLLRLGRLAGEAHEFVASQVEPLVASCVRPAARGRGQKPAPLTIDCGLLAAQPRYLVREILITAWREQGYSEQAMGFDQWDQLAELAQVEVGAPPRKSMLPGGVLARREGNLLTIRKECI